MYDCHDPSIGIGAGYTTLDEWNSIYHNGLDMPNNLKLNVSKAAIFIFIPSGTAMGREFSITMDFEWMGFYPKSTTLNLKEAI